MSGAAGKRLRLSGLAQRRDEPQTARPGRRVGELALLTHIRAEFAAGKQTDGRSRMVRQSRAKGLAARAWRQGPGGKSPAVGKERVRKFMEAHVIRVNSRRRS